MAQSTITPHRMEQFEDASQRWSLRVNQFGNIGEMLGGTVGAAGCGALGAALAGSATVTAPPTAGQSLVAAGELAEHWPGCAKSAPATMVHH